jgi:O-antigen/teichoic acid export membrane protein
VSLKANIVANYAGQGWTALMGIAFVPVNIHYLGIEAYGLIGIFALLQTWLSLLDLGLTPALSREMARFAGGNRDAHSIRDLLRSVEWVGFGVSLLVAIGVWLSSNWLASDWLKAGTLPQATVADAFSFMGVITGLRFVENIYRSSLVGLQRQVSLNVATGVLATVRSGGAVAVLVFVSPTVYAFFLWQVVASLATVAVLGVLLYRRMPQSEKAGRFSLESLRGVWRFAAGTLLLTVLGFLLSQTDKLVLTRLLSLEEFAYYSLAFAVASSVRLLAQPVDQGIYPRLTALLASGDEQAVVTTYHRGAQFTVVLMGSIAAFLAVFGQEVLELWTRDPAIATQTYPLMRVLILGMILNGVLNGPFYLQMAAGWTGLLVRVNLVLTLVYVPAVYVITQQFGAMGAALSWLFLNVVYVVVAVPLMHQKLLRNEMRRWLVNDISFPLLAAFSVLLLVKFILPSGLHAAVLVFCFAVVLAITLACAALAASDVRKVVIGCANRLKRVQGAI